MPRASWPHPWEAQGSDVVIFGLIDYAQYRWGVGPYAAQRLTNAGWQRATPENFAGNNEPLPGCFFVMHRQRSFISWLLMYGQNSHANHAGLHVGNGMIVDMLTTGAKFHPLAEYFDGRTWLQANRNMPLTGDQRMRIVEAAMSYVGQVSYNWHGVGKIGMQFITGVRSESHPRLWTDVALILAGAAFMIARASGNSGWPWGFAVASTYVGLVGANRVRVRSIPPRQPTVADRTVAAHYSLA